MEDSSGGGGWGGQPACCVLCLGTSIPGRWELAVSLGPCSPLHLDLGRGALISASLSQLPWPLMEAYVGQKCGSGPAPMKRPRGSVLWGGGGGLGGSGLQHPEVYKEATAACQSPIFSATSVCAGKAWNPEPLPRDTVTPKVGIGQARDHHHGRRRVETQPSGIWVFFVVVVNTLQ